MTGTPRVTAVIVTRDRPELLRRAIASIVAQDTEEIVETVVVFDRSEPDGSLVSDDPRRPVRVAPNARTPGLPGGRNTGVELAAGEIVAFCDDDDEWEPAKLRRQLAVLDADPTVDVVVTGVDIVYRGRRRPRPGRPRISFDDLLRDRIMEANLCTAAVRRVAFEHTGPVDEKLPGGYAEDYEWLLRAARERDLAGVVEPLVRVHWHDGSFYAERWHVIDEALGYLLGEYPEFDREPAGLARILGQRAFARAAAGRRRDACRAAYLALRANPAERRVPLALAVAAGVPADRVLRVLKRFGRGV